MNKIFKVVWSKTKECYVVVSEVAKNNGGKKKALASVLAGLAMVAAAGTMGTPVQAGTDLGNSSVNISPNGAYNGSNHVGSNSIVVGYQNTTDNNWGTVAIGAGNTATENSAVAVGNGNEATGGAAAAFGAYNKATGRASVAIGNVSMASGEDSIAIGNRANSNPANQDRGSGQYSIAMGRESWARGTDNISIGHNATTDSTGDSIAIGRDSTSNSVNTVTIGAQTKATGGYAVAIGRESEVNANFATAMGYQSKAKGSASIAIGKQNNSNLGDTITMGNSNTANTMGGIAIGKNNIADSSIGDPTTATKENSQIAIGLDNKATSQDTVAIGREAESTKTGAVSLGARTKAKGDYAVAIGSASQNKTVEAADYAVAVGAMSKANGDRSVAIGGGAETTAGASRSVAQGYKSSASVADGVALGSNSKATVDAGVKGFNPAETRTNKYSGLAGTAQTSTLAAVSVGDGATATRQITGLAAGTNDTDAVNVAQLRSVNLKYAGDTGNGDVLLDDGTLKIKGDDPTFISTSADKNGVTVKAKIGADITNTNGKAVAPTTNGIATTDNVAKAINESGWNVVSSNNGGSVTGTQASKKVSPGDTVTLSAGKNIVLDQTDKQFTYSLNKDVDLTKDGSLTIGDTKVNKDGLTITGGPSVTKTGIDAGNKNITNVKAGVNDTDAVNVKQLKDAKTKLVDGKNTKVTGEGTQDDPYKVNVEGDLKGITSISNADNGPKMTIGGNSINITGGPLNMGGSKITNVAPGTDDTDAVNVKQLKSAKTEVKAGNGVTVAKSQDATDGHDIYTVSSTGATGNTDPSKVEGGKNTTVTGDGTAATPYKVNVQGDLTDISSITNGDGSGKISFAGDQVVKVDGDHAISLDGKGGYVTGLQNKDWDITNPTVVSGRAATEDQLKKVSDGFNNTIKLAGNTGNTDTQKFNKTGGLSFGVVGANNGQYIKTTASGTDVVADLSDDAKAKLNHTFEVAPGSSNVTVSKDTTDPNKTVYKVAVANTPAAGASSTESVVKKAAATGDTNIADVTVGNGKNSGDPDAQYEVNVSRNAVKDAAREAVTVNNGGTTTGGNYTADADNPITVNPVKDDAKHNTTYEVKFDGEKAAKQIPLTYKANGTGDQTVKLDKGLNFTNGSNTTASVAADGVVKYDLNKDVDLTKNGSLTIGDTKVNNDGVTITGGPSVTKTGIDAGNKKITNVAPATDGTDAVNYDQLKAARTVVTSNDKSVTINKTTNGDQVTYDLHVNAAAGTASTWNLKSGAVSATEGTHSGDTDQNIADGKSVTMQAGKNLTVTQTNDGAGNTEVAYALDKDLKDLDSVTTKEVKLGDKNDNISIKKDGDRITYSTDGGTTVKKVANLDDEKHIKPGSYAVQNDGSVTMTYVDGNGKPVTGEEAKITGIAKNDLSNITDDGKKVITGLGSKVKAGDNVTVTDTTDATTGQKTYTVNAKLAKIENGKNTTKTGTGTDADPYKINVEGDLTDINSITNGAGSGKLTFGPNETVTVGGTNPITLNAKTGNIGGLTNKTFDPTNIVSGQAATEDQLKSVHDTLKASELHIAPTAVKAGSTEAKGGVVSGTENVYKYDAGTKKVTLTYNDGNGKAVTDTKAVIDFSDLNIPAAGNNYSFKTNATGNLEDGSNATETEVASGKTVNFGAGKNMTVKQEIGKDGNQTYTYALNKDLTNLDKVVVNGKDGQPGKDGVTITGPQGAAGKDGNNGKVGISGKDGKDAVSISGKDGVGHIGLTGPAGKDGKNATADITVKDGVPGVDGQPGETMTRIVYQDKDGNEHEVATHDDGMKFAGDDGQDNQDTNAQVIKKHLNKVVDIVGGADKTKLTSTDNIGVNNVGGKLKVQLAKNVDLDADGSLTTGATKVDNNGVTITAPAGGTTTDVKLTKDGLDNGGNKIVNVKAGENDTDAVNVKQLKDKVTTVESSDGTISVTDKNDPTSATYDAAKGHQY
ncbi:ESPR-type extended signal peptide-containing protein, partial [Veillonella sp.]|uniref:ESPR-type extended signal peptide-containing protein n=1 Tax=Veillonella sp. TaxID=1926307 RepID=UPI0025EA47E9